MAKFFGKTENDIEGELPSDISTGSAQGKADKNAASEKIKEAMKLKRKIFKQKLLLIATFALDNAGGLEDITRAAKDLLNFANSTRTRTVTKSPSDVLAELFGDKNELSEMEVFGKTKWGRQEMRVRMKAAIKNVKPENRVWVRFDVDNEKYVLIGKGANPPAGWIGYVPIDV